MAVLNWNLWFPTSSPTVDDNRPTTSPTIIGCLAQKPLNSSWCVTTISLRECVRALSRSAWRTHVSGLESSIWLTCGWIMIASLIVYVRRFLLPPFSVRFALWCSKESAEEKNEITKYLQSFSFFERLKNRRKKLIFFIGTKRGSGMMMNTICLIFLFIGISPRSPRQIFMVCPRMNSYIKGLTNSISDLLVFPLKCAQREIELLRHNPCIEFEQKTMGWRD